MGAEQPERCIIPEDILPARTATQQRFTLRLDDLSSDHCHTFRSTPNKPNFNYILGTYLTFVFALNRQFSKQTVTKYFNRLRQLLKKKFLAIRNRTNGTNDKDRKNKTWIRFSSGEHVIFLGFYIGCGTSCNQPTAFVMSQSRWRCGAHINDHITTKSVVCPKNHDFIVIKFKKC
jgi:hypothetical protein